MAEPSRVLQLRNAGGFELSERIHQPAWSWSRHAHERASISLLLAGSCVEQLGRFAYTCAPGAMHILPAGEPHAFQFVAPVHCLTIEVDPARAETLRVLEDVRQFRDASLEPLARRLTFEMRTSDAASELAIESLVLGVLAHGARTGARGRPPRWLSDARDALHGHFREKVTLSMLAAVAGVHPSYVARAFRRQYGCTVGEYVRGLRLDYAAQELRSSERAISDVAAEAGFFDHSHFARLFRRRIGMTPAAFRAAQKSSRSS
jgi:AraC family transcriptional regulator